MVIAPPPLPMAPLQLTAAHKDVSDTMETCGSAGYILYYYPILLGINVIKKKDEKFHKKFSALSHTTNIYTHTHAVHTMSTALSRVRLSDYDVYITIIII